MLALVGTALVPCVCPSGFLGDPKKSKLARICQPRSKSYRSTHAAIRADLLEDVGQLIISGTRTLGIPVTVIGGVVLGYTKFFGDLEVLKNDVNNLRESFKKDFDNLKEEVKKVDENHKNDVNNLRESFKKDFDNLKEEVKEGEKSRKSDVEKQDKKLDEKFEELKGLLAGNLAQRLANVEGKVEVQGRMMSRDESSKAL